MVRLGNPMVALALQTLMTAEIPDLTLVQRVQQGDRRAFDQLVLRYQHKVLKLVMRYMRNHAEA